MKHYVESGGSAQSEGLLANLDNEDPSDIELDLYASPRCKKPRKSRLRWLLFSNGRLRSRWHRRSVSAVCAFLGFIIIIIVAAVAALAPSYSNPPQRYKELRARVASSEEPGRGNPSNQKIYIAASLYDRDGSLASGLWADAVLKLVDILGPENVYLSVYESDSGSEGKAALKQLQTKLLCNNTMVVEETIPLDNIPKIKLPNGGEAVKRIAYLAAARNRALAPLDDPDVVRFDKVLYLNDIIFHPIDAAQLLFSTNNDKGEHTSYLAACSVDFINPFKFYDTFATRDVEGFSMGLPIYPWFSTAGEGRSRRSVLLGSDAVTVQSCWGGMVAFDARYFQQKSISKDESTMSLPLRFRHEADTYWDASECCLIHADLQAAAAKAYPTLAWKAIVMNPYVRVAYDPRTLSWLPYVRRVEKLLAFWQWAINQLVSLPHFNPRRTEKPGDVIVEYVQDWNVGEAWQKRTRIAGPGGFCQTRMLEIRKTHLEPGEKNWEKLTPAPLVYDAPALPE